MSSWIASDKSTRIPISTFQTALELHDVESDAEEVECMLANMVFRVSRTSSSSWSNGRLLEAQTGTDVQGFIKGYISHEKSMVVLAKTNPFPNLNSIAR